MNRRPSAARPRSLSAPRLRPHDPDQPLPHTPPPLVTRRLIVRQHPAPPEDTEDASSPDPPLPRVPPARQPLVSPPPLRLNARPTVTKLPRITERRRLLISHQPMWQHPPHWPQRLLPEERSAQRSVHRRLGLGASVKSPVYIAWGAGLHGNAMVSVLSSPLTAHASAAAQLSPVFSITCVIAQFFDIALTHRNAKSARHDYLMGAIMLHQEVATRGALQLEHRRTGHPINPQDLGALEFNIMVLGKMMERFESAYYPRSQQPYLQQIRDQIAEGARALAELIAQVDGLARERGALQAALHKGSPHAQEQLLLELQELDTLLDELQAAIAERQKNVVALLSRRRLRERARAQLQQLRGQLERAQRLAQARERVNTLSSEAAAALFALSQAPQNARSQAASQDAREALRQARHEFLQLVQGFAPWQQALEQWKRAHGRAPRRPEQAAILRQLLGELQAQVDALQREVKAFRSDWWRGFLWYDGLPKEAVKRLRDLRQQWPLVPLRLASTALSIASLAVDVVGAAFGNYGLTLVSSVFALLMARGENKDGRLEQYEATLAKLTAWTRLCRAGELMAQADGLANETTRALAHTAARVLTVCAQRSLLVLHRASTQAQLRRTKGELNYLLIVVSVVGGAAALGTGGAAAPFVALPQALVGGLYLGSIGVRVAQQKLLKHEAQGREAVALAFVREFGIDEILVFYTDMKSAQPQRLQAWRQRLQAWYTHWHQGQVQQMQQQALPINELFYRIKRREFEPEWLWDNDFLFCQCCTELMHRHVRDHLHGPCVATDLLRALEMAGDVLDHLMNHFAGFPTPAAHRRSTELHIAGFLGAKPYPLSRLPAHIDRRPTLAAPHVERLLQQGLQRLSAPTQHKLVDLLLTLQEQGEQGLSLLTRTDEALRRTLTEWIDGLRQRLQSDFIGPHELLALQQELIENEARRAQHLPTNWSSEQLPLLCSPLGPLWLELLADPSYLRRLPAPPAEPLPPAPPGPALLAELTAAMKLIGRALRDGDLLLDLDLHMQRRKAPRESAHPSLAVNALRLAPLPPSPLRLGAPPGAAEGEQEALALASRPGLGRRFTHSAFDHGRSLRKRVQQTGRNPMSTPAKALAFLRGLQAHQAARVCGWVLEQWVRQHSTDRSPALPRSPQVMAQLPAPATPALRLAAHLRAWLVAVGDTALRSIDALRRHLRPSSRDQAAMARLRDMRHLCELLIARLDDPATQLQLREVRLIG